MNEYDKIRLEYTYYIELAQRMSAAQVMVDQKTGYLWDEITTRKLSTENTAELKRHLRMVQNMIPRLIASLENIEKSVGQLGAEEQVRLSIQ